MTRAARASWRTLGPLHSLFLLTALALLAMLLAAGCASGPPTPSGAVGAAYEAVAQSQRLIAQSLDSGRISAARGAALFTDVQKARKQVDEARDVLALCGGKEPCPSFREMLSRYGPTLAEAERKLRAEEGRKP